MALVKDTNSYVNLTEADAYFEDRLDVAAWDDASNALKEQALVTATIMLDTKNWVGYAVSSTQPLAFPRVGTYFDPRLGIDVSFEEDATPDRIKQATFELAYHLLNNDGLLDDIGYTIDIAVGPIKLNEIISSNKFSGIVQNLIKPLLINAGSHTWWRAN